MSTVIIQLILALILPTEAKTLKPTKIKVEELQKLTLAKPIQDGRGAHVSAASGMVEKDGRFYIVADDDPAIFILEKGAKNLKVHLLSDKVLSSKNSDRKKHKPDYEALEIFSAQDWPPNGALVAWPSGSTDVRTIAAVVPFNEKDELQKAKHYDVNALFQILRKDVRDLNIEGFLVSQDKVFLFQRGNSLKGVSGYFELSKTEFLGGLKTAKWPMKVKWVKVDIGQLDGVKLTLADGVWTENEFLGIATAENSISTYADGAVAGTVLLRIGEKSPEILGLFDLTKKFEGWVVKSTHDGLDIYLVDDADDPALPSCLYKASFNRKNVQK